MKDQDIIDACYEKYVNGRFVVQHFKYLVEQKKLPASFCLIADELGSNDGKKYPNMRLEQWRGWWVCTAPAIKWWWLLARVEECSPERANEMALSVTYMQR